MSIQDLIQAINTQLPDNNKQLITEAILRGVLENMVNTLSTELRVFNINASDVTNNGDGTYTLASVENELMWALAFDEDLNIYQYNGTHWTLKTSGATAAQGLKADNAIQPGDNAFELDVQYQQLTDAPTITWDVSQGEIAKVTLEGNRTLANPTNLKAGRYDLIVEQDGVGGRTLLLENSYKLAGGPQPTLSSGAGEIDTLTGFSDGASIYFHLNQAHESYVPQGFVITVDTTKTGTSTNTQFTIPTSGGGYNYSVKDPNTGVAYLTGQTGNATVEFGAAGVYDIEISGDFPRILFNNTGDKGKLIEIKQWGNIAWTSFASAFHGCNNLEKVEADDAPNLFSVNHFGNMFFLNPKLDEIKQLSSWDVSGIANMGSAFYYCISMQNLPIQNWNIENVTNFVNFAYGLTIPTDIYDQILNNWAAQSVKPSLNIHFGNSKYSPTGQTGRDVLINTHGWMITDGGLDMPVVGLTEGDSFADGVADWPNILSYGVQNYGTSGNQLMSHIEPNYAAHVASAPVGVYFTIIQGGVNDMKADNTLLDMQNAINSIISIAKGAGLDIGIVGVAPWASSPSWTAAKQTQTDDYNTWLAAQASIQGFTYIDIYTVLGGGTDSLLPQYDSGDGLHPSGAGQSAIAAAVDNAIASF